MIPKSSRTDDLDGGDAFLPDPRKGISVARDTLAEMVAEDFVSSATSADDTASDRRDQVTPEEVGGPFVEVEGEDEFAVDTDESNPADAPAEPFPTAMRASER